MSREHYESELKLLHANITKMGTLVEQAVDNAITAFINSDIELCKKIIDSDKHVNDMEKEIESMCLWLIAREQPIASDLRKITAALKIITDMERIGDHGVDIAELTKRLVKKDADIGSLDIPPMAAVAIDMVRQAVTAYVNDDLDLAHATEAKDDEVDKYFHRIKKELVKVFTTEPVKMDTAIDILLIAKYLERVADHAVNICEWVHFSQTGEHKNTLIF
ncbi:MAG: phosphate signaling complex protein PhoU [Propionibacteriaceae bacterium]|nr:phosphate signaling complex protein PhoU [Propionibacteriaceae bacterium]